MVYCRQNLCFSVGFSLTYRQYHARREISWILVVVLGSDPELCHVGFKVDIFVDVGVGLLACQSALWLTLFHRWWTDGWLRWSSWLKRPELSILSLSPASLRLAHLESETHPSCNLNCFWCSMPVKMGYCWSSLIIVTLQFMIFSSYCAGA